MSDADLALLDKPIGEQMAAMQAVRGYDGWVEDLLLHAALMPEEMHIQPAVL